MADKKTIGIYKAYLKEHLSKKRYTHSVNVANSAVELAKDMVLTQTRLILQDFCMMLQKRYQHWSLRL